MRVILDFPGGRKAFQAPLRVIAADTADQVPAALAAVTAALADGCHVAGWLGYELGYTLEPRFSAPSALRIASAATGTSSTSAARAGEADLPLLRLGVFTGPSAPPVPTGRAYAGKLAHDWDEAAYLARFEQVKALIAAGDIYQANLSYRARFAFAGDPLALYERLRHASNAPWCGFVDDETRQIASISPELFFDLGTDGVMASRPMKGTAPRLGDDVGESAALASDAKSRAENLMIVDLIRNDLGRIAQTGSVAVQALFRVETYPTLHTLVSTVAAQLRPDVTVADILRALFPCGSVTGAPKIRAMEVLRELEDSPRGAYCGAVGYFSPDGAAQFNVAIRTLTVSGNAGVLGIGGGVVQDSVGTEEYAECRLKARFFEDARPPLALIETLHWNGDFVRLASHLSRLENSARVFALPYEAAKARAALDSAVAGREGPQRVRLTLDEAGRFEALAAPLETNPRHWTYAIATGRVQASDPLQRHKTSWRSLYEKEASLADEVLFLNERGELAEGARSNIFILREGVLLTPPLSAGALDGRLRAELLDTDKAREATLTPEDLKSGEVYFGNSLRGLIRAVPL